MESEEFKLLQATGKPKRHDLWGRSYNNQPSPSVIIDVTHKGHSHLARWSWIGLYFTAHTPACTVSKIAPAVRIMRQIWWIMWECHRSRVDLSEPKHLCWQVAVNHKGIFFSMLDCFIYIKKNIILSCQELDVKITTSLFSGLKLHSAAYFSILTGNRLGVIFISISISIH